MNKSCLKMKYAQEIQCKVMLNNLISQVQISIEHNLTALPLDKGV